MAGTGSEYGNGGARAALGIAAAVLVGLFAWVLIVVPDRLFADDSYFYFQVAWNFARGLGSTFNGVMPTNGYHPLWMLVLAALYKVVPGKLTAVHAIGALIAVLDIVTLWTVREVVKRVAGDVWPLAFLLLVPFCFASQLGTEGALSGMMLAGLMLLAYRSCAEEDSGAGRLLALNLTAALAVLSRLDNIFIVALVWVAVWMALDARRRRLQLAMIPVYAVLWGAYLGSNVIYFHTLQPISGVLKSGSGRDHALGANLPHTALFALAVIVVCLAVVAWRRRDLFFRVVEVPFAAGVLLHAGYIVLRMSSETKWTWYYTSWMLLAGVLLARAGAVVLEQRPKLAVPVEALCLLALAAFWVKGSYVKFYRGADTLPPASFNETLYGKDGIRRAFAYDQPGMLAYYSDIEIVPLDGLMGNLKFQQDLASKGIRAVAEEEGIDAFIGPPEPLKLTTERDMCNGVFLATVQFHCVAEPDGRTGVTAVDVYARVPQKLAGTLELDPNEILWKKPDFVAVWRLKQGGEGSANVR